MRFILKTLFCCLCLSNVISQNLTNHPLSNIGIGEVGQNSHSIYDCLGRGYDAYYDSSQLNYFNPSSYSSLSSGNTLLSLGINSRISNYTQGQESTVLPVAMVDHFALGFKIMKRMGLAFGLTPFSKKGYEISERIYTGVDSLKYIYSGSGTVNNLFLGFSYSPINTKKIKLSTGFNIAYLFGTLNTDRMSLLIDNNSTSGGLSRTSIGIKAFHYNLGITYKQIISKNYHIILAGTLEPDQRYNASYKSSLYTSNNIFNPSSYDTLSSNNSRGHITSKFNYSLGLSQLIFLKDKKKKNKTLHPNLLLTASYRITNSLSSDFDSLVPIWNSKKGSHLGFGIQYSPETKLYENIASLKLLDKLTYRMGGYYDMLPYFQNGNQYTDRGVSLGLGIPILAQQSLSSVNFSFSVGQRSNFVSGDLNENYIGINAGIILSPASFERWFRKRKLD
ncbi:MAG: hypothetical protein NT109_08255 [Flavobacteriia bacterium]|nr:hypothetical protein [Flavobacteriia bacterium]